jgi:hypothetical protein
MNGLNSSLLSKFNTYINRYFNFETLQRIWDCYLAKGELFIYEVALSLLKIQEKDLVNVNIN